MTCLRSITSLLLLLPFASFAQQVPPPQKHLRLDDIQVQSGVIASDANIISLGDFRAGLPTSEILSQDFNHLQNRSLFSFGGVAFSITSVRMGFSLHGKSKDLPGNPQLRVGLTTHRHRDAYMRLGLDQVFRTDTFTSATASGLIYQDSIFSEGVEAYYESNALLLDGSLVFRTKPGARCSAYAGAGAAMGMSTFARTFVAHNSFYTYSFTHSSLGQINRPYAGLYGGSGTGEYENTTLRPEWSWSAYVPLGIDLRVGRADQRLGKVHVYGEVRSILIGRVTSRFGNINTFAQSAALGLRVELR